MDQVELATWAFRLSIVSFFVSCASCIVALQQLNANRRHQRLSLSPCFTTNKDYGIDEKLDSASVVIKLENKGIGPAIIDKVTIYVDDKEIIAEINEVWDEALKVLRSYKDTGISYRFESTIVAPNHCVAPKDQIDLLRLSSRIKDKAAIDDFVNRCKIKVKYHTFYLEGYEYSTDLHQASTFVSPS